MEKADAMQAIRDMAKMGGALTAGEAVDRVADLVAGLDQARPSYEQDVETLLRVGALLFLQT